MTFTTRTILAHCLAVTLCCLFLIPLLNAQGTLADYQGAHD
jgi:hypothetical protein